MTFAVAGSLLQTTSLFLLLSPLVTFVVRATKTLSMFKELRCIYGVLQSAQCHARLLYSITDQRRAMGALM